MESKIIVSEDTNILLYDGSSKLANELTTDDLLISPKGNFIKPSSIERVKTSLVRVNVINGRPIICKNSFFLMLDKYNCRRPTKELENAQIISSTPKQMGYLVRPSIDKIGDFLTSKSRAWMLGLAAANGRFVSRYKKTSSFTFFSKNNIIELIKNSFPCASVRKEKKLVTVTGSNIIDFLLLHLKANGLERKLSSDVVWMNKELQLEFIKGWFSNKYSNEGLLIGSSTSKDLIESIMFILSRLNIPYSIMKNKLVISASNSSKITNIPNINRKEYRSFNNNILFQVKDIINVGYKNAIQLNVNGVVANGYSLISNKKSNNVTKRLNCLICNKIINLQDSVCSDCQNKQLEEISWRYGLRCQCCNKEIESSRGTKKFCSDVCRRKIYNPLSFKNNGENMKGYVNKGFLSYPQGFIYSTIKDCFKTEITYNDRTVIRNPNTNYPLELDIWLSDKKVAIEFDGKGHFIKEDYATELDDIKNKVCIEKNIKLIRISYKDPWMDKNWIIKKVEGALNDNC